MAPNPAFVIVEQVSIKLFAWSFGLPKRTTSKTLRINVVAVSPKTVRNTNLNVGVRVAVCVT
jgi:hypothetical protein